MLVNNIDIANFKGKLLKKDIQTAKITIYDDWLRNALNPLYLGKQEKFKPIKIQLLIEDVDDESCLHDISNLIRQFEKCTVKFDDLDFYYDCTITNKDHERLIQGGYFLLNVELKSGYAYKTAITETLNQVSSKTINVPGTVPSPAVVTVTAPVNTTSLTLTGLGSSITINNLVADVPVIIDGETYTIMSNGLNKFADVDLWGFPVLQAGENVIGVSSANCVISIVYKPKFI